MKRYVFRTFEECVKSVLPRNIVRKSLGFDSKTLRVRDDRFPVTGNVHVVGFGKAVLDMALEVEKILNGRMKSAVVSVPYGTRLDDAKNSKICAMQAAKNNVPDRQAVENTDRIKKVIDGLDDDDVLIVLISGGGSALLCSPTVPLPDKIVAINLLSSGGASIEQLNAVRKALSSVKGGRLIGPEKKFTAISLILSDIVGDPPGAIASGPTVPAGSDDDDRLQPMDVIGRFNLERELPETVLKSLAEYKPSGRAETVKKVHNYIIGNNAVALRTAVEHVKNDFQPVLLTRSLQGNVTVVSKFYSTLIEFVCTLYANGASNVDDALKNELASDIDAVDDDGIIDVDILTSNVVEASSHKRGMCFVSGGETTVKVQGTGLGGRNQELALRVSVGLSARDNDCLKPYDVMFFSGGTDGIDGPTDACGAFGYPGLVEMARSQGLNPSRFLENNDSYGFYSSFNDGRDLLKIGHTGTNVMDVHVLIVKPK